MFPDMNITQDGQLVKWTFTAEDKGPKNMSVEYPELWIMRSGTKVFSLSASVAALTAYPNVYDCVPDSPQSVKAGDYIAVLQPPKHTAQLLLSFVQYHAPGSKAVTMKEVVPLVSLEVIGG